MHIVAFPFTACYDSPVGHIEIKASNDAIHQINFRNEVTGSSRQNELLKACLVQLDAYFKGTLKEFTFPVKQEGTGFQQQVWNELLKIPFGKTQSYLQLARQLGDEKVIRAAANANGKNQLAIVVPCHRVIGTDGSLTGYAGGLHRKQWLLDHEARVNGVYAKLF